MILDIVFWYLAILLGGWLAFPLLFRLLPCLPDRGLALARPAGLLLWGYAWWLLTSFHILENNGGGVLLGLAILAGASAWAVRGIGLQNLAAWLRENRSTIWMVEGVFLGAFLAMVWVRGVYPDISGTEKPMELAFINAILRSPSFPPHDPWLSGYAISYYYFGYALVAMLARFSGAAGEVAFNLALASWFALSASAAAGLVYNLLALKRRGGDRVGGSIHALSLLAPLFLLVVSNLEGFLEMMHARGLFWTQQGGEMRSPFWSWLGIQELVNPPAEPFSWVPGRPGGIWWWRASRVLQDFDVGGGPREIIDEFPFFSYLLGDLHPHVLSMPFVLLAVGLSLHVYLRERSRSGPSVLDDSEIARWLRLPETWLAVVALGGLAFLNTWDFPIYLALYGAATVLAAFQREGWKWKHLGAFAVLAAVTGLAGIAAYLPFYLGFQSQAGGFLPSLVFFTRGAHLWVMFAPLLVPLAAWLIVQSRRRPADWKTAALLAAGLVAGLWLLSVGMGAVVLNSASLAGIYGGGEPGRLLAETFARRLAAPGAWLTLLVLLALSAAVLVRKKPGPDEAVVEDRPGWESRSFAALLALVGTALVLFPEFFYLRDQFGWRMNTIFKFYYQAWVLWSLAAAYASARLWQPRPVTAGAGARAAARVGWVVLVAAALVYPAFGLWDRTRGFDPDTWTLDGSSHLARFAPDDLAAIQWLKEAPYGVVVEAVGGSYSGYARAATFSGQPGVLGWPGHESQWRGGAKEMGSREADIEQLYRARRWEQASEILRRYNIRYVFAGSLENSKYGASRDLFARHLPVVFTSGQAAVYEVPTGP